MVAAVVRTRRWISAFGVLWTVSANAMLSKTDM
jgi:hypothetical protein